MKFTCDVTGSPEPKVTWFKGSMELHPSRDFRASYDGKTAVLEIMDASQKDIGEYFCSARNFAGERKSSALLTVQGEFVLVILSSADTKLTVEDADSSIC